MSAAALEALLARIYTDGQARARFLEDPARMARELGVDERSAEQLRAIDLAGLLLTAKSLANKRASQRPGAKLGQRLRAWFRRS